MSPSRRHQLYARAVPRWRRSPELGSAGLDRSLPNSGIGDHVLAANAAHVRHACRSARALRTRVALALVLTLAVLR